MQIGTFGNKVFSVSGNKVVTFNGLERSSAINTEDSDNGAGKQKVTKKSIAADTLSFGIKLSSDYVNVKKEIESWIALQNAGKAYYLIIGKSKYGNYKWLVTGVSINEQEFFNNGTLKRATINISLKEKYEKQKSQNAKSTRNTKRK